MKVRKMYFVLEPHDNKKEIMSKVMNLGSKYCRRMIDGSVECGDVRVESSAEFGGGHHFVIDYNMDIHDDLIEILDGRSKFYIHSEMEVSASTMISR